MFNKILIITIFLVLSAAILAANKGSAGVLREQGSQIAAAATTSDRVLDKSSQSTTDQALALAQAEAQHALLKQKLAARTKRRYYYRRAGGGGGGLEWLGQGFASINGASNRAGN